MSTIPINDKNELLKWLTMYFLDNDELDKDIYDELLSVYKQFNQDPSAIELYKQILLKKEPDNMENMSFLVLEQILSLVNKDSSDLILEMLYEYHFKFNKQFIMGLYNEFLTKNVGNDVTVVISKPNEYPTITGKLNEYKNKESIKVDENIIPFVGYKSYIKEIKNDDQELLYFNDSKLDPTTLIEDVDVQEELNNLFDNNDKGITRM